MSIKSAQFELPVVLFYKDQDADLYSIPDIHDDDACGSFGLGRRRGYVYMYQNSSMTNSKPCGENYD